MTPQFLKIDANKLKSSRWFPLEEFLNLDLIDENVYLAGGSLRTLLNEEEKICDYDIFFRDLSLVQSVRDKLIAAGAKLIFECPEGKLFTYKFEDEGYVDDVYIAGMKIQLICENAYDDPIALIDTFDLSPCLASYDGSRLYIHTSFIRDVRAKNISLHQLTFPVSTIKRIYKYIGKGYHGNNAIKDVVQIVYDRGNLGIPVHSLRFYID